MGPAGSSPPSCTLSWAVKGSDGSLVAGQSCELASDGTLLNGSFSDGSVVLMDATHITLAFTASATVTQDGRSANCMVYDALSVQKK